MAERAIDTVGVRGQLRRLLRQQAAAPAGPWLHGEVARRLGERLALVKARPGHLLEWWGALGAADAVLREAYPQARRTVVEPDAHWAAWTRRERERPWWSARRWRQAPDVVLTQDDPLPPAAHGLVFANLALDGERDPPALFARWQATLAVDGFVMFSCFGPETLKELRPLYERLGFGPPGADFVDMHDLGDMLVHAGFADPVMDQERLTLTWASPGELLAELRSLGGNVAPRRAPGLRTPRWRARLERELEALRGPDGRLRLGFEIAYGHAFKAAPRAAVAAETRIGLQEMRDMVRANRPSAGDLPR